MPVLKIIGNSRHVSYLGSCGLLEWNVEWNVEWHGGMKMEWNGKWKGKSCNWHY